MRKLLVAAVSMTAVVLGGFTFSSAAGAQEEECQTIVEIAASNPDFSTLVTAVTEAGLVETLNGEGPFTVFAPTNAAFAALPAGTLDTLLADPPGALTDILKLHVLSGAVDSAAAIAAAGTNVESLGGPVPVALEGETLTYGGAAVVTTDIEACNGIIHVIDAVVVEGASVEQAPTTTAPPAPGTPAAPSAGGDSASPMPMPTSVNTGDSGLAATNGVNGSLIALLVGVALMGLGSSALVLARRRD